MEEILSVLSTDVSKRGLKNAVAEFIKTGDIRKLVVDSAPLLDYASDLLSKLKLVISSRDAQNSLVIVRANKVNDQPVGALLAVIITPSGGDIVQFPGHLSHSAITNSSTLRQVLGTADYDNIMKDLSTPWIMAVMELLLLELKLYPTPDLKSLNRHLGLLCKTYGILPPSFLIHDVERDGEFPVKGGGMFTKAESISKSSVLLRYFSSCTATDRQKLVKTFCREALIWKQLDHPNIPPFLGVAADLFHPSYCLISPWMFNGNINEFLQQSPKHNLQKAVMEIAEAMKYLHGCDPPVVHSDIRGANVLVTDDFRCCLADFGLTSVAETQPSSRNILGSVRWMAPEYLQSNAPYTSLPSRDIYAFACTVLEIYTGKTPFPFYQTDLVVLVKILEGERPQSDHLPPGNGVLSSLLEDCWHRDPTSRPSAAAILQRLQNITVFHSLYSEPQTQTQTMPQLCTAQPGVECTSIIGELVTSPSQDILEQDQPEIALQASEAQAAIDWLLHETRGYSITNGEHNLTHDSQAYDRFQIFFGQNGARLNSFDPVYGEVSKHSLVFDIFSPVLFSAPDVHLKTLENMWVDQVTRREAWKDLVAKLTAEWEQHKIFGTILLTTNAAFLAIPSVDLNGPGHRVVKLLSYLSIIAGLGCIMLGSLLHRQHKTRGYSVTDVHEFLTDQDGKHGLEALAVMYSLPYALSMWGTNLFLAAFLVMCYVSKPDTCTASMTLVTALEQYL